MESSTDPQIAKPPRTLLLDTHAEDGRIEQILKALASDKRIAILRYLGSRSSSINEIAESVSMPTSTATMHINILEEAGLVRTELKPANRGLQKICARVYDQISIQLPTPEQDTAENIIDISMPVGAYVDCQIAPTCGVVGEVGIIGELDDMTSFYHPEHIYAQLIWFRHGYVEYRFPNRCPNHMELESLQISAEICSEAPHYNPDWPSDITMWVNEIEIGTWTSPGDFGGQRGILTPSWWDEWNTQYGLLKLWRVTHDCTFIDGVRISDVTIGDLNIAARPFISLRIGVKNVGVPGGVNLFGAKFGNYPQDILMRMRLREKPRVSPSLSSSE
ncbi:MAG: helix-turn-helix domain-containing protein [Anaerolineae bacterium]